MARPKKEEAQSNEQKLSKAERIKAIQKLLEKDYGKGTLIGANDKPMVMGFIPTGSIGLDLALGIGGLPKGRIIEIYGPEASGKTSLCLETIKMAQRNPDSFCAIVDAEHALDTRYASKIGVDLNRLQISQPDYGEQALEIAEKLIESGDFDVVVVDSVAALTPKSEIDGEMGDANMGKQARMMSQAMRKLVAITNKSNTVLIFTNQLRDKIGVMFGNPETTTGGNALKFYASVRIDIRRSTTSANSIMEGERKIGNLVKVKVIKNKVAPPFRECEFDIRYNEGFDEFGELIDLAAEAGVIGKSGQWYDYNGTIFAQGREKARLYFMQNSDFFDEIKEKVISIYQPKEFEANEQEQKEAEAGGENTENPTDVSTISTNLE